jgi:hypothetical protein
MVYFRLMNYAGGTFCKKFPLHPLKNFENIGEAVPVGYGFCFSAKLLTIT